VANGLLGVGGDALRTFRDRPALVVGGAVLGLIGLTVLGRSQGGGEPSGDAEVPDPTAGLFPGVDTYGGGVPGSGSVPFAGYPVAGGYGGPGDLPSSGGDLGSFLPPWGLSCNGEPKPSLGNLPAGSSWACTDDGWQYVPPPPAAVTPPPPPSGGTTPAPGVRYVVRITKGATVKLANLRSDGKISSWTDRKATATATYASAARIKRRGASTGTEYWIAKLASGPYAGRYVRVAGISGVSYQTIR
jgi:hypothetical protein